MWPFRPKPTINDHAGEVIDRIREVDIEHLLRLKHELILLDARKKQWKPPPIPIIQFRMSP